MSVARRKVERTTWGTTGACVDPAARIHSEISVTTTSQSAVPTHSPVSA